MFISSILDRISRTNNIIINNNRLFKALSNLNTNNVDTLQLSSLHRVPMILQPSILCLPRPGRTLPQRCKAGTAGSRFRAWKQ